MVRRLLQRSLGPSSDVEDHVQETFLRFFRLAGTLRDPGALSSFITGIALRVAREELRRRRLRRWLLLTDTGVPAEPPTRGADHEARQAVQRLYAVLDRLDAETRLVFVLRYMERLELVDVAAALGCSLATVKRRIAAATTRVGAMVVREPALAAYVGDGRPESPGGGEGTGRRSCTALVPGVEAEDDG